MLFFEKFFESAFDVYSRMFLPTRMIIVLFVLNFASADSGEPKIKPFQFTSYLRMGMRDSVFCAVVYGAVVSLRILVVQGRETFDGLAGDLRPKDGRLHFQPGHLESGRGQ
ncbi:hypothetical protein TNCT_384281 [Trichonephila clavata]|uniref:Uncharacterized protein n=1 Tax=Trichonephila clavata TaxID=2740835 RepID=A0A8X6G583_TRICU|nr:hypothetical protein TNCT_384281 [Trichonephila clavata]